MDTEEREKEEEEEEEIKEEAGKTLPLTVLKVILDAVNGLNRGLDIKSIGALMRYLGYAQSISVRSAPHTYATLPLSNPLTSRLIIPVEGAFKLHSEQPPCPPIHSTNITSTACKPYPLSAKIMSLCENKICPERMKTIRELSSCRTERNAYSRLSAKNTSANFKVKMNVPQVKPDLHPIVLMLEVTHSRPSVVNTEASITLPSTVPKGTSHKKRNGNSQTESVNFSKLVTFTASHDTVINNYQTNIEREYNNNAGRNIISREMMIEDDNKYDLPSNLNQIICTEVEKLRILQLLRDHDMKGALEEEKVILEERRLRKTKRNAFNMSWNVIKRKQPLSKSALHPSPHFNPHSNCKSRPQSRLHSEEDRHPSKTLCSSYLHSTLLIPKPLPTQIRTGAENLFTLTPILTSKANCCNKSIPSVVNEYGITPRSAKSTADSCVDFDDSVYIPSLDGNDDDDDDDGYDDDDKSCNREADDERKP